MLFGNNITRKFIAAITLVNGITYFFFDPALIQQLKFSYSWLKLYHPGEDPGFKIIDHPE